MTGHLLIVDDVPTKRIVLKAKLASAGYDAVISQDPAAALRHIQGCVPDLILIDLGGDCGLALIRDLRARAATRHTPVIILAGATLGAARLGLLHAGADEVLSKPVDDLHLLALIRSHMRRKALGVPEPMGYAPAGMAEAGQMFQPQGQIALITARAETGLRLRRDLSALLRDQVLVFGPDEALSVLARDGWRPDAVIIDADLSGPGDGLRLMSDLQSRSATCHARFLLMLPAGSLTAPAMAYDLGAHGVVEPATPAAEIAARLSRLIAAKQLEDRRRASVRDHLRLAAFDPLTGLLNRRHVDQHLPGLLQEARRNQTGLAVLVVDLDRFKRVNDKWGHAAGDAVLVAVAGRMAECLRTHDLLARMGGEEFLAILPNTTLADARAVGERLCQAIERAPIQDTMGRLIPVTVSVGVAACHPAAQPELAQQARQLVDQADRALMHAKSHGRNQVTVYRSAA